MTVRVEKKVFFFHCTFLRFQKKKESPAFPLKRNPHGIARNEQDLHQEHNGGA